jgi:hypothetical protein
MADNNYGTTLRQAELLHVCDTCKAPGTFGNVVYTEDEEIRTAECGYEWRLPKIIRVPVTQATHFDQI